jgi:hypothetical protein
VTEGVAPAAYGADSGIIALPKSEDAKQGPLAFAEKRQPIWKAR